MAKALPRKWHANTYSGRITLKKMCKWDEFYASKGVIHFFDTWEQAHKFMTEYAARRLKKAKAELPKALRMVEKAAAMVPPAQESAIGATQEASHAAAIGATGAAS